jgi:hypothetical protein
MTGWISELVEQTDGELADGDLFEAVDVSDSSLNDTGTNKQHTASVIKTYMQTAFDARYAPKATYPWEMMVAVGDETTAISATGTGIVTFRMPYAVTLTAVRLSVNSATSSGTLTLDINEGGTTILSTKLTVDATELTSVTAAAAAVISDAALADDAIMSFDWDGVGDGTATGAKVTLYGTRVLA